MVELRRTNEADKDFLGLVGLLDKELAVRDDEEHGFYAQFNRPVGLNGVVIAYLDGNAVGCGAFKRFKHRVAEIKRMFVKSDSRGQRIGGSILAELENWAEETGYSACVLETGFKQPEAIALHAREGYQRIPNYGQYDGIENSVCMKKSLVAND